MVRREGGILLGSLALIALLWLAAGEGAWAAPGQSPMRQSFPTRTPTAHHGQSTVTPDPGQPTSPRPSATPKPGASTVTPEPSRVTQTRPIHGTPTPSPSPSTTPSASPLLPSATADAPADETSVPEQATKAPDGSSPTITLSKVPNEKTREGASRVPEGATTTAPQSTAPPKTKATDAGKSSEPTRELVRTRQEAEEGPTVGRGWILICGLGLILVAVLLMLIGRGRRDQVSPS